MNILHRVVRKTLRLNPTRTLVTIIGIMLSMALTVAVLEGAYSGLQFMLNVEGKTDGYYQGYYHGLDETQAKMAAAQDAVKNSTSWQLVGWSDETGEGEDRRPLLAVDALGTDPNGLLSIRLAAGRMPQNDSEILLPANWFASDELTRKEMLAEMETAVGTTMILSLGERVADNGEALKEHDEYRFADSAEGSETLQNTFERSYTVVGVYWDFDRFIEPVRFCYRALTVGRGNGEYRVFFTLRLPTLYRNFEERQSISENIVEHSSIMRYYGVSDNSLILSLYSLSGVLVVLVAFGSISLIYNSFSISVSERTHQFGILRSVGATKKQIRAMVRHEAVLLGLCGIALGIALGLLGIGITLRGISPMIERMMSSESLALDVRMQLVVSPIILGISALVCMLTTLISAWIPARRAVRINVIDAIRQTGDIKLSPREVKTSGLTQALFGFEGMMASKNFKRNRKRYRSTVLSLFLSIVLFISASSLTVYIRNSVNDAAGDLIETDLMVSYSGGEDPETLYKQLLSLENITDGGYYLYRWFTLLYDTAVLSEQYKALQNIDPDKEIETEYQVVAFVDDSTFRAIAAARGRRAEDLFSGVPRGLIVNDRTERVQSNGRTTYQTISMLNEKAFPVQLTAKYEGNLPAGWYPLGPDGILPNEALSALGVGEEEIPLYEEEAYWALNEIDESGNSPLGDALLAYEQTGEFDLSILDRSKLRIVPESELYHSFRLTLAGTCVEKGLILPARGAVLYPVSRMGEVLDAETASAFRENVTFCFRTENHSAAVTDLFAFAEENGLRNFSVNDLAESVELERMIVTILNIFAYGFIILISLIAVANVFNTVSTNVLLRRREFAMLKSIGLSEKGFAKMMNYECLIYGCKGLLWGLPAAVAITWGIWFILQDRMDQPFYLPWHSVAIAVGSVFAVVFATILYASRRIRKDNPIDALKNENL